MFVSDSSDSDIVTGKKYIVTGKLFVVIQYYFSTLSDKLQEAPGELKLC